MPVDDTTRAKLAKVLGMLGAERAEDRAAAGAAVAAFVKRSGIDWEEALAGLPAPNPASHPDTEWEPAEPIDGNPGSWRWYRGYPMAVRRCRDYSRCHGGPPGRWYATVDGAMLVDRQDRLFFATEAEARAIAEAVEEHIDGIWYGGPTVL